MQKNQQHAPITVWLRTEVIAWTVTFLFGSERVLLAKIQWLASYPKSGNTWIRAFLRAYQLDAYEPIDVNQIGKISRSESRLSYFLDFQGHFPKKISSGTLCYAPFQPFAIMGPHRFASTVADIAGFPLLAFMASAPDSLE